MKQTRLKKAIIASGYKQTWIAAQLKMDPSLLCRYVTGDRVSPPDLNRKIALLLKIRLSDLE